uniref:Uncharacterized protein n=1 Tax=Rhizophora mucronata TaxID=61149 RepID=A0A2P2ISR5_RHIMU
MKQIDQNRNNRTCSKKGGVSSRHHEFVLSNSSEHLIITIMAINTIQKYNPKTQRR